MSRPEDVRAGIHIERPVMGQARDVLASIARDLGLAAEVDLHVTISHCRSPVDWRDPEFLRREDRVEVSSDSLAIDRFGDCIVLLLDAPILAARHADLAEAGATWDFPTYNPHITIAKDPMGKVTRLPAVPAFSGPILLGPESRRIPGDRPGTAVIEERLRALQVTVPAAP